MSNYKTELENAITGVDDLICTMNAIGDAMNTGESAAADYVGAIRVLAEAATSHTRDLKAIRLCMTREDDAQKTNAKTLLNDITDYLTDALVYHERVDAMMAMVCEDYFNETKYDPDTETGKEGIAAFFNENRIFAWIAKQCLLESSKALSDMKGTIFTKTDLNWQKI